MDVALLLNINTGLLEEFPQRAKEIVDGNTQAKLTQQRNRLKQIEDSITTDNKPKADSFKDAEIIKKIRTSVKTLQHPVFSYSELRRLSFNLNQFIEEENCFKMAFECLSHNWLDIFIHGLHYSLCNSWNEYTPAQRTQLSTLLKEKVNDYHGAIKKYNTLKQNITFISENGPNQLAIHLVNCNLKLEDAPKLLGSKYSAIHQSYYSDVVVEYVKVKGIEQIVEIEQILLLHKKDRTRKLVYAQLIENAEKKANVIYQQRVSESANRFLGDITINSTWAPFEGATPKDVERLEHAKFVARLWFIRQAIEVFFERCIQDPLRKRFWLSYIKHISDFRIAGSSIVKNRLIGDSRLSSSSIKNYFIESSSYYNETAALILKIKDHIFVEFSDVGALYCYMTGHPKAIYLERNRRIIDKVEDLKEPKIGALIDSSTGTCYKEGKVMHSGKWEERMHNWMKRKLGVYAYHIAY